jgi:phospholipid/cholesterol/gamma-HCH transport system permease protein
VTRITVDALQVGAWDSTLITFLLKLQTHCSQQGLTFDSHGLPSGIQGLLKLATAVPPREGARRAEGKQPFLARLGDTALRAKNEAADILSFIGEAFLALCRFFAWRA